MMTSIAVTNLARVEHDRAPVLRYIDGAREAIYWRRLEQQKATNDMSKIAYKPAKKDKDDKKPSKGGKGACGKAK
jgi:hypothetical protein